MSKIERVEETPGSGRTEYHQMLCGRLALASLTKVYVQGPFL